MRIFPFAQLAWAAVAALCWAAGPARAADLYLAGDLGISWFGGEGTGTNNIVGVSNTGSNDDVTPVYGAALGTVFPLNAVLPWQMRMPGGDEWQFPEWEVRTEVEHLRGRDAEIATPSFNALDTYRVDAESWTVMGKARLDVPLRTPIRAVMGRVPFFEPASLYLGGGAGIGVSRMRVNTGVLTGKDNDRQQFAWQALAGIGYDLTERVKISFGWRYLGLGEAKTPLFDSTNAVRGRYKIDLEAHEFTTSLAVRFWQLPPLLGED
jgi:opacity protein-like surface antigen